MDDITTTPGSCRCYPATQKEVQKEVDFELYTEGDHLFKTMIHAIENARYSIQMETYIFADDDIGRRFANALLKKAQAGLDVRLLVDAVGSMFQLRQMGHQLKMAGVKVQHFHRWHWRKPFSYNRRDHRKLLVVDKQQAFLGGFNIHNQSSRKFFGDRRWRDTHVSFKGELACQAAELFDAFWQGEKQYTPLQDTHAESYLVPNQSRSCRQRLACIYDEAFTHAKHQICLTTPYFVPDHRTQKALIGAVKKGVNVRLLVPLNSDVRLARWAANAVYAHLLRSGVEIFEYVPRMLHAKVIVVDSSWATLGTANLDYRSLFQNYELNLVTRDKNLCHYLQRQFENDIKDAEVVSDKKWQQRPWVPRLAELLGWSVRRWL